MRVKNIEVIKAFLNGLPAKNHGDSLVSDGEKLVNYNTTIGEWHNGTLFINRTKYSVTTSKLQNYLVRESESRTMNPAPYILNDIPIGTREIAYADIL